VTYNEKLGEKVRLTREKSEMSVEELAERAGIETGMITAIEKGELVPYLSPLIKVSRALGVRLGTFLDDQEHLGPVVTRNGDMAQVERFRGTDGNQENVFYSLARNKTSRHMEPMLIELHPDERLNLKKSSHEGEEFIYVLAGEITIEYGKETYNLTTGDSIYYDSIVEHNVKAAGSTQATLLAVIHEPA
jgi:quercetin dioxygenase-like cupin family protein